MLSYFEDLMLQDAKDNLRLELKHWLNSIEEKSKVSGIVIIR